MADIVPTYPKPRPVNTLYVQWILGANETGLPINVSKWPDKTLDVNGTFGAAVTFEGTNDERGNPANADYAAFVAANGFVPITDSLDTAGFSKTANGGDVLLQNYKWIRPKSGAITGVRVNLTCSKGR